MTIALCDMESEDIKIQCMMWTKLNKFMRENEEEKPNFKGFIEDSMQAN